MSSPVAAIPDQPSASFPELLPSDGTVLDTLPPSETPVPPIDSSPTFNSPSPDPTPSSSTSVPPSDPSTSSPTARQPSPQQSQQPNQPNTSQQSSPSRFSTSTRSRTSTSVSATQSVSPSSSPVDIQADEASGTSSSSDTTETSSTTLRTTTSSIESVFTTSEVEVVTSPSGTRVLLSTTTRQGVLRTTTLPEVKTLSDSPTSAVDGDSGPQDAAQMPDGEVKGGMDTGARVGMAIGIIAAIAALIVVGHYIMRHKRHIGSVKCRLLIKRSGGSLLTVLLNSPTALSGQPQSEEGRLRLGGARWHIC